MSDLNITKLSSLTIKDHNITNSYAGKQPSDGTLKLGNVSSADINTGNIINNENYNPNAPITGTNYPVADGTIVYTPDIKQAQLAVGGTFSPIGGGGGGIANITSTTLNSAVAGNTATIDLKTTATFNSVTINNTPQLPTDAVNLKYVSNIAVGITWFAACRLATTGTDLGGAFAADVITGPQTQLQIDGVNTVKDDRILVKDQTDQLQNGIYIVSVVGDGNTAWELTRANDYTLATADNIKPGNSTLILEGTINAKTSWVQTNVVATLDTNPINFVQYGASIAGGIVAQVTGTDDQIVVQGTTNPVLSLAKTDVEAGVYTSADITVDGFGRITAAASGAGGGGALSLANNAITVKVGQAVVFANTADNTKLTMSPAVLGTGPVPDNQSLIAQAERREKAKAKGKVGDANASSISNLGYVQFSNNTDTTENSEGYIYLDSLAATVFQHQTSTQNKAGNTYTNICTTITGGEVGASSSSVNALFEINSTSGGFLPSRLAGTDIDNLALTSLDEALIIYNKDDKALKIYNGSSFDTITVNGTTSGITSGNSNLNGTNPVLISTNAVTANSNIFVTPQVPSGSNMSPLTTGSIRVCNIDVGKSFSVCSTVTGDTAPFSWMVINQQ